MTVTLPPRVSAAAGTSAAAGDAAAEPRMGGVGLLGSAILLVVGLFLQRTLLPLLPYGPADLLTMLVAILGLLAGPAVGCIAGFCAGFAADLLSDHTLGRLALVLCLLGYAAGLVHASGLLGANARRSVLVPWAVVCGAAALAPALFALTGTLVADSRGAGTLLAVRTLAGAGYALVFTPFLYPLLNRLLLGKRAHRVAG